ncbi:DUF4328 domain-containing protein [Hymenobacter sp. DG01]|uniref:DUF4328 domain-containing protein n=1 Tax=Hymenobacter sp. DG01 TaxID=2584940 RepID=UPI0015DD6A31|nr:DUF4328 domain-containing protein [Hymenobacter sp. DG01]
MIRDNAGRGQMAYTVFLGLSLFSLAFAAFSMAYATYLRQTDFSSTTVEILSIFQSLGTITQFILLILSIVVFMRWLRRAYYNLAATGFETNYADNQAVIAWFLPVMSMYRPYRITREVWQVTQGLGTGVGSSHGLLRLWWALFLLRGLLGLLITFLGKGVGVEGLRTVLLFTACTSAFDAVAAYTTARVIQRIVGFEQQLALKVQVADLGQAAPEHNHLGATEQDLYL